MSFDSRIVMAIFLLLPCAACGGGGGGGSEKASMSGTIAFPQASMAPDTEPNGTFDQAQPAGKLAPGSAWTARGRVGEGDELDGFAFYATERVEVVATLAIDDPFAGEAGLRLYDPTGLQFTDAGRAQDTRELRFVARGPMQLVVERRSGAVDYTLELRAVRAAATLAESEPNDAPGAAMALGALEPGESLALRGAVAGPDDVRDRFLVALPFAAHLNARVQGSGALQVALADATANARAPRTLAGGSSAASAELGGWAWIEVAVSGEGEYVLQLAAGARPGAPSYAAAPAPLALEGAPASGSVAAYGEPALAAVGAEVVVLPEGGRDPALELARWGLAVRDRIPGGAVRAGWNPAPGLSPLDVARRTVSVAAWLSSRPGFVYAERNLMRQRCDTPNDTHYPLQWHYQTIQLPAAWDVTHGDPNTIVAVIDTGETQHPDLIARQIAGYDFISDPGIAGDGDGIDPDPTDVGDGNGLQPSSFHGTHVAGTIGADTDNNLGVAGVTWAGKLMHLRVLGIGGGTDFDIANAILYAGSLVNNSGTVPAQPARVINMSLGGPGSSQTVQNSITAARNAGVVIFAAAGNNNSSQPFYPASYNGVMSVSAVDLNLQKAPYSNFNASVDVAAPGGDTSVDKNGDGYVDGVLSTLYDDSIQPAQPNYVFYQGTSMACPHAAGVAALIFAVSPAATPAQVEGWMTSTATDLGAPGKDVIFGHGLINAYAAVVAAGGTGGATPVLSLSTQTLAFAADVDTLSVQVTNVGANKLLVNDPTVSTMSGGNWLSATRIASGSTTTDTSSIQVDVDRTGLADNTYQGAVDVTSNGGNAQIQVTMVVSATNQNPNVTIYVLAVDSESFETLGQAIVNPSTVLDWKIGKLPAGSYYLAAGSDDDNDGFIGGDGDIYIGLWPTLDQPLPIDVDEGDKLKNLEFAVQDVTSNPAGTDGSKNRRFRILDP